MLNHNVLTTKSARSVGLTMTEVYGAMANAKKKQNDDYSVEGQMSILDWMPEADPNYKLKICVFSKHECNKKYLWEVADSLDEIQCPHVCCRKCNTKSCGARCNGSEEPHKSLRAEYDLPVPKDTKWDMRGYCDVWHYVDEELPVDGDIFWTYTKSGSVPLFGYSAYFKDKWWRWREWEHKWSCELGRVEIIAYMQIPTIQRHKDKSLQEMFGLEGIVSEGSDEE